VGPRSETWAVFTSVTPLGTVAPLTLEDTVLMLLIIAVLDRVLALFWAVLLTLPDDPLMEAANVMSRYEVRLLVPPTIVALEATVQPLLHPSAVDQMPRLRP